MGTDGLDMPVSPRFVPLRTGWAWLRPRAWLVFLTIGLGLAVAGAFTADEAVVQPWLTVLGLTGTAAILVGIHIHTPARSWPWYLVALCVAATTIGIGVLPQTGPLAPVGQVVTAVGYAAGFAGFVMLIRGRIPGGERGAFLDAAILAAGIGVLVWAFGFAPYVSVRESSAVTAAFFYPALVASAVVARMWFIEGAHRPATRLLIGLVFATNAITMLTMLRGVIGYSTFTGLFILAEFASLAFVGAAALHPSMAIVPERQRGELAPVGRRRIIALSAALLVNPATLAIEVGMGRQVDPAPYLIGGAVIGLLVIARLGDALRQLGESLRERDSLMELLRRQALYDNLTSLPNRGMFNERLAADFANRSDGRLLAVLLVDLDDFKSVNDTLGHEAGDDLLVAVGQRLRGAIRDGDIAARLGGDEFVIALPACADPQVPLRVAQRVLASLGRAVRRRRSPAHDPGQHRGGRRRPPTTGLPRTSSATPTSPCTWPRAAARAGSRSMSRRCRRPR